MILKPFMAFCDLCHEPLTEKEHEKGTRCDKCRKNPIRVVEMMYGPKEKI